MRRSVIYALLIALPPAFAVGSGVFLATQEPLLGLVAGGGLGTVLFAILVVGREYGSPDGRSVGEL